MTIYGMSGKPRSGKSYSVVENCIIPAIKEGRVVFHNMVLKEAQLRVVAGSKGKLIQFDRACTPDELVAQAPSGALIVIDESLRYWPAGTKSNQVPKAQLEFFTMHGHNVGPDGRTTDIVLICQDFGSQCAAFIRELIEINYYSVKLSKLGMARKYRLEVYDGVVKGDQPSQKRLIRKTLHRYRPEIYSCYVSHTNSQKGLAGEEFVDKRASIWKSWPVIAAGVAAVSLIPLVWWSIQGFMSLGHPKHLAAAGAEHSEAPAAQGRTFIPVPGGPLKPPPAVSSSWRFAGVMIVNGVQRFIVEGLSGPRWLHASACHIDGGGNWICMVDGERVTAWTGPPPPTVTQFVASAVGLTP